MKQKIFITALLLAISVAYAKPHGIKAGAKVTNWQPLTSVEIQKTDSSDYQLITLLDQEGLKMLKTEGFTVLSHYPNQTYLVKTTGKKISGKLSDKILKSEAYHQKYISLPAKAISKNEYILTTDSTIALEDKLKKAKIDILSSYQKEQLKTYFVKISSEKQKEAFNDASILLIEEKSKFELFNDVSTNTIMKVAGARSHYGRYGASQIVAVCDSGFDNGSTDPASHHQDFTDGSGNSRLIQLIDLAGDGPYDPNSGHGTHVSGSVLGNGMRSGSTPSTHTYPSTCFAGSAPEAKLFFQASEAADGSLGGLPDNLYDLYLQAYTGGARIHTNSWGSTSAGAYTTYSNQTDDFMNTHQDMLILFSAGNSGIDSNSDGKVDLDSIGSPGTAKNCLTIGASENYRNPSGNVFTYGTAWPTDFPTDPVNSDQIDDNMDGLAAFSSRGPTDDNRYKPELVAPGTNIISVKSQATSGTGWGAYNNYYMYMGGTSMSTPLAAGCSAIMREFLQLEKSISTPTSSLIKAALINSATDMSPGQYGSSSPELTAAPDLHQGFGRINMENALELPANLQGNYQDHAGLTDDQTVTFQVNVADNSTPLSSTLCWIDPPSTAGTGGLINNLDMTITAPDGSVHTPLNPLQGISYSERTITYDDNTAEGGDIRPEWSGYLVKFTNGSNAATLDTVQVGLNALSTSATEFEISLFLGDASTGALDPSTEIYGDFNWTPTQTGYQLINTTLNGQIAIPQNRVFYVAFTWLTSQTIELLYDSNGSFAADNNFTGYVDYSNNYDYIVEAPVEGKQYFVRPTIKEVTTSGSDPNQDTANNVEKIVINSPQAGTYTIAVKGDRVQSASTQQFSVVTSGNLTPQTGVEPKHWTIY